jgi:hypothetical protein
LNPPLGALREVFCGMTKLFATWQWETAELLALTHCSIVAIYIYIYRHTHTHTHTHALPCPSTEFWSKTNKEKAGSPVETLYSNTFKLVFIFLYLYTKVRARISPHKHLYRLLIAEHEKLSIKVAGLRQEVLREIWHTTYCLSNKKRNGAIG